MQIIHSYLATKRHVIWDWNGTLLGDIDHAVRTVNRMLSEESLPEITLEDYKKVFGFPVIKYYQKLGFKTSPEYFQVLCERFNEYFLEGLPGCSLWPGAREALMQIKAEGKMQSILSASEQNILNGALKHFAIEAYFDHTYGIADKLAGSKIERGRELLEKAQTPLAQTVLIGDTDHDLEVGEALGIDVILVGHGHQCPTRLKAIHHTVIDVLDRPDL